jgi:hypothetical protein
MGIDRDEDDLGNGVETNTGTFVDPDDTGTNPALADTDGDGFDDGVEVAAGSDPNNPLSTPDSPIPPNVPTLGPLPALLLGGGLLLAARLSLRRRRTH